MTIEDMKTPTTQSAVLRIKCFIRNITEKKPAVFMKAENQKARTGSSELPKYLYAIFR